MYSREAQHWVVLTGAGVSAESGLRTFRDNGGLWEDYRVEDVATPEAFERDPELVLRFYNERRAGLLAARPNAAHEALVRMERHLGDRFLLVTQNVDDLHERAGSRRVLHMHGELRKLRCLGEGHVIDYDGAQARFEPCQHCGAPMRPHIVWFGEIPLYMEQIEAALADCTHFAYLGTSSNVYPAAGFKRVAAAAGARVVCVNLEPSHDAWTHEQHTGQATKVVPRWVDDVIAADRGER